MELQKLYAGSFIDWEAVAASWNKRTVPSRLLLFAARRYLDGQTRVPDPERFAMLEPGTSLASTFPLRCSPRLRVKMRLYEKPHRDLSPGSTATQWRSRFLMNHSTR